MCFPVLHPRADVQLPNFPGCFFNSSPKNAKTSFLFWRYGSAMLFPICIKPIKYVCVEDNISKTLEVTIKKITKLLQAANCSGKEWTINLSCSCGLLLYLMKEGLLFFQVIFGHSFRKS